MQEEGCHHQPDCTRGLTLGRRAARPDFRATSAPDSCECEETEVRKTADGFRRQSARVAGSGRSPVCWRYRWGRYHKSPVYRRVYWRGWRTRSAARQPGTAV